MSGLRITNATLGTVTLHDPASGVYGQLKYVLTPSEMKLTDAATNGLDDGGEASVITIPNIREAPEVYIDSGSQAALETVIRTINLLCEHARFYQKSHAGGPVYLEYRTGDSGTWFRSEIIAGWAIGQDDMLDRHMAPSGRIKITLNVLRRFYWEGAESYVTLTNQHGTNSTGLTVYNTNDSNGDNFATITTTIAGDLPAPIRLEYTNSYASGSAQNLFVGLSAIANPAVADVTFETSAMTLVVGSTSTAAGASYSNGSQRTWTWAGTSVQSLGYWTIPASLLLAGLGMWYRVFARIDTSSQAYQIRANVKIGYLTQLSVGEWATPYAQSGLVDLGAIQLPPYVRGVGAGTFTTLTLDLEVRATAGGSYSVPVDCVHLVPTESFRMLRSTGYGLSYTSRMYDDQVLETTYADDGAGGGIIGNYQADGSKIMLRPSRTNRLYFLVTNNLNASEIARTGTVRVAYRPRYRML